jgi:prevent-host-death family protein
MARLKVGIRTLKNELSRYVARVRRGDEIVVTDRGAAVARLVPVEAAADHLERLVAAGLVERSPQGRQRRRSPPSARLRGSGPSMAEYVRQQRR